MTEVPTDLSDRAIEATDAPVDEDPVVLDVRSLGPPEPLRETLEYLTTLPEGRVVVQVNDRAPQHLYPRLSERGFAYQTVELDGVVATTIWHG